MKKKNKKIKSSNDDDYEYIEELTESISKQESDTKNNITHGFDDIFQKIDMLHKDYQSRFFSNDFGDLDSIFKSYFCGLQKTDNKNGRN